MAKRILLAGFLGGIALFFWGFVSHTMLPLGEVGVQSLGQEKAVIDGLKTSVPQPGLYFFPWMEGGQTLPPEKAGGPWGILIYHPTGAAAMMTGQLINEFVLNVVQALIAAFLLSLTASLVRFPQRVGFVFVLGIVSALGSNIEYWNWYGFPGDYTLAALVDELIGFLIVGFIVAAFIKPPVASMQVVSTKAA